MRTPEQLTLDLKRIAQHLEDCTSAEIDTLSIMMVDKGYWIIYQVNIWDTGSDQTYLSFRKLNKIKLKNEECENCERNLSETKVYCEECHDSALAS